MKNMIKAILFLLIIMGVSAWAWKNFASPKDEATSQTEVSIPDHAIVVTYFTSDQRCQTCYKIEKQTRHAIENGFADELASKKIVFQIINFDQSKNKHFIDEYELSFKTVVISERQEGKETAWSKYDKVWELVDQPSEFADLLQEGVNRYLKKGQEQPTQTKTGA